MSDAAVPGTEGAFGPPGERAGRLLGPWWRTRMGSRLLASFGALLCLFVVALAVCLHSFASIAAAERDVEAFEHTSHAADRASIGMREQYIH